MVFARAQIMGFCRIFILSKYFKNELCSGRKTMSNSGSAHNDEHSGFVFFLRLLVLRKTTGEWRGKRGYRLRRSSADGV